MNFIKTHKTLLICAVIVLLALAVSFNIEAPVPKENEIPDEISKVQVVSPKPVQSKKNETVGKDEKNANKELELPEVENTDEVPTPVNPEETKITSNELKCTLSVRCDTILSNMDKVKDEKKQIIPSDGIIYPSKEVVFYEGETAFNVILREMQQNRIHFEFENTPTFDSVYIEGIGNIYEFDAGDLSGWLYKVNGTFLNYSLSRYPLKNGDKIEIVYTCNLGKDIGGGYTPSNN